MIVSIHQPNYLPWLGFFDKMNQSDIFVLLDNVQFTKNGFQNRTQIKTSNGPVWLTVPVLTSGHFKQLTNKVRIDNKTNWQHKHFKTIEQSYSRSSNIQQLQPLLENIYQQEWKNLVDLNVFAIKQIAKQLGIKAQLVLASQIQASGQSSNLLLAICKQMKADIYLTGPSGKQYLKEDNFQRAGIKVLYHQYQGHEYDQLYGAFVPKLSVIDYLFNCGSDRFVLTTQSN